MRRTSRVIKHVLYEPPVRKSARIEKGVPEIQKFRAEKDDDNSSEEEGVTKMRIKPVNYNDLHVTKIYKEINEVFVSLTNVTHKRMKRSRTNVSSYYEAEDSYAKDSDSEDNNSIAPDSDDFNSKGHDSEDSDNHFQDYAYAFNKSNQIRKMNKSNKILRKKHFFNMKKKKKKGLKKKAKECEIPLEDSEYEKIRQANLVEQQKKLKELGLLKEEEIKIKRPFVSRKGKIKPVRKSSRIEESADPEILEVVPEILHNPLIIFEENETPDSLVKVDNGRFKILKVKKECTIEEFAMKNNIVLKEDRGFYEFTKPEIKPLGTVVVLVGKNNGEMFMGPTDRPPTNFCFHKWRVFIQTGDFERMLMAGTSFLFEI